MKLCLCFHCLCKSYEEVTGDAQELFVSLEDMRGLIESPEIRAERAGHQASFRAAPDRTRRRGIG